MILVKFMIEVTRLIISDWHRYTSLHEKMNPFLFLVVLLRNPGMYFSVMYRIEHYLLFHSFLFKIIGAVLYPFYFVITYYILDIDISPTAKIGKALYIHNRGIVFSNKVIAGDNLSLNGPLTIGTKRLIHDLNVDGSASPFLGNNVSIGVGARIIGDLTIGDNVQVGANAVVLKNIPSYCIVGGVPARIIGKVKKKL